MSTQSKTSATHTLLQIGNKWVVLFWSEHITTLHTQFTPTTSKADAEAQAEQIVTKHNQSIEPRA